MTPLDSGESDNTPVVLHCCMVLSCFGEESNFGNRNFCHKHLGFGLILPLVKSLFKYSELSQSGIGCACR